MAIQDQFLQELHSRIDINDLISSYVTLGNKHGRIRKGLCPFHNEKTPSFAVYEDTQSFYCFGCGAGGDIISFMMKIENLDYIEAVRNLAQRAGLAMPEDGYDDSLLRKKNKMLAANKEAARFFHEQLMHPKNKNALDYFLNRGLTIKTIKHFGLGYAPDSWDSLLKHMYQKGFSQSELYEANLVKKSTKNNRESFYDNFRNRMITPIIDLRGNVVGFGGRVLDDSKPKYINTADTLVYKKSNGVFALNFAKSSGSDSLIVAEGYMDVIALHQAGFTNAVACLGTALTKEQARLIKRYTDHVILSYDADGAGQEATKRAMGIFGETGLKVRVLRLQGGKDPDEILKKYGPERFRSLLENAENDIEFTILKIRDKYNIETNDGKAGFVSETAGYLATVTDPVYRDTYVGKISQETGISKEAIELRIKKEESIRKNREKKAYYSKINNASFGANDTVNPESKQHYRASKAEESLIVSLIQNQDFWMKLKDKVSADDFITSFHKRVFKELISRIEAGREIELAVFNEHFTFEEMGRITQYFHGDYHISNTMKECEDCIKVLKEEKTKGNTNIASVSDEEFVNLFKGLNKQ